VINKEVKTSAEKQAWVSLLISTYNIYHYHLLPRCFSIVLQSLLLPSSSASYYILADISGSRERHRWKLQFIRRSPYLQKCYTASIKYKQLRILKMATRFIAYNLKLIKEKYISKSLCKSTLKEFSTFNNNQLIKRSLLLVRVSTIKSDFFTQKVNKNNKIIIKGTLTHYIYYC
jgi:hypothetical protein